MSRTKVIAVLVLLAGLAFGMLTIAIARREPAYAFVGGEIKLDTATTRSAAAGSCRRVASRPSSRPAGRCWPSARRLGAPANRGLRAAARRRRVRLVRARVEQPRHRLGGGIRGRAPLYAAAPPLIAHAALVYPNRRLPDRRAARSRDRVRQRAAHPGHRSATVFDPEAGACTECPSNPLLVEGSSRAFDALNRIGVYVGFSWSVAAASSSAYG